MKKLFVVMLSALCLSSCSQNERLEDPTELRSSLGFSTYIGTTTKVAELLNADFKNFKVEAYSYASGSTLEDAVTASADDFETYIPMLDVARTASDQDWTYTGTYYWPSTASVLDFYAYSSNGTYAETPDPTTDSYAVTYTPVSYDATTPITAPTLSYTAGSDISKQIDLVAASVIGENDSNNNGSVNLAFKHILAQINFKVKGAAASSIATSPYKYVVSNITLNNVESVGTYTYDDATTASDGLTGAGLGTWTVTTGTGSAVDYEYYSETEESKCVTAIDATNAELFSVDGIMLIPQATSSSITIDVEYKIYQGATLVDDYTGINKKRVTLTDGAWVSGQNLIYNLILPIDATPITFTTDDLEEWVDAPAVDTTVPATTV